MKSRRKHVRSAVDAALVWPYWWIPALVIAAAAVVMGFVGFRQLDESNVDAAFDTIDLFGLDWPRPAEPPPILIAARILASIATVGILVKAALALFARRLEGLRARRSRDHVIVCGLGRRGGRLVSTLRGSGWGVVAVEPDSGASGVSASRATGAFIVPGDATSRAVLAQAGVSRASAILVVGGDDETNLEIAATAAGVLSRTRRPSRPTVLVQLNDPELCRILNERGIRGGGEGGLGAVEFISPLRRGAAAMIRRHPPPAAPEPGKPAPTVLVIGFTDFAEATIVAISRLWGMREGSDRLRVVLADAGATAEASGLMARYSGLARSIDLQSLDARVDRPEIVADISSALGANAEGIGRVYVCLDAEAQALSAGLRLRRWLEGRGVTVVIKVSSSEDSAGRFVARRGSPDVPPDGLALFGLIEETCTAELLLEHRVEVLARALHERYVEQQRRAGHALGSKPALVSWDELGRAGREASREHAREMGAALQRAGFAIVEIESWDEELIVFSEDEVEVLAQNEHRRWMDAKARDGFRLGERDDVRRFHPDLVPWDALDEAAREIDRELVRARPELLAIAGFALKRAGSRAAA